MSTEFSLTKLIRLSPPFDSDANKEKSFTYWKDKSAQERIDGGLRLIRVFYASLDINADAPMQRGVFVTRHSFEQENEESEEISRAYATWKAQVS